LQHYAPSWMPKRSGGWRLVEAPKPRLKDIQRRILHGILDHVSPHDAAFGFVPGRSCTAAAAKHAGEAVVVALDLRDFFMSIPAYRVHALFRCLGYPWGVARLLTGLCTTATPHATLASDRLGHEARQRLRARHLPQGAPTSPTLANFAARRLDLRLDGLARRFEARYTRYADDLTFSGDESFHTALPRFLRAVAQIARDEGFALNDAKTRIMPRSTRQTVTGIVVNDHINVARNNFDALKATLANCVRHGPASQNRDAHTDFRAHLDGRIAWVERLNLRRGEKLRRLFDAVAW
jgi:RNA-directed DNA polymerase